MTTVLFPNTLRLVSSRPAFAFSAAALYRPVRMLPSPKVFISGRFSMLKGSLYGFISLFCNDDDVVITI